jgi:hypothetical protein
MDAQDGVLGIIVGILDIVIGIALITSFAGLYQEKAVQYRSAPHLWRTT